MQREGKPGIIEQDPTEENIITGGTVYENGPEGTKQTVKYNTKVKLAPPSIERKGYVLLGYARAKNASYPDYYLGKYCKFKSNVTLYAVWAKRSEVYDRYGDSFSYGIDFGKLAGALDEFSEVNWAGQPESEKRAKAVRLVSKLASLYGLSKVPSVTVGIPPQFNQNNTKGVYDRNNNTIYINPKLFNRDGDEALFGRQVAKAIVHEMRHAYQYERVLNPRCRADALYIYNLQFYGYGAYVYIKYDANGKSTNRKAYQSQIIEAEALGMANLAEKYLR